MLGFILTVAVTTSGGALIGTLWESPGAGALIGLVVGVALYSIFKGGSGGGALEALIDTDWSGDD